MGLTHAEAFEKIAPYVERPCALLISDAELWGLERGMRQVVVFDWPKLDPALRAAFVARTFVSLSGNSSLMQLVRGRLEWTSEEVVPFALLGREGLLDSGAAFEAAYQANFEGVLLFDLMHGPRGQCPVLLWDGRRLGKVINDPTLLGLRQGAMPAGAAGVLRMVLRTFVHITLREVRYWQIEVEGRTVKIHRGLLGPSGVKDWTTNESKEREFSTSAEAMRQAQALMEKYLGDGYIEREGFAEGRAG